MNIRRVKSNCRQRCTPEFVLKSFHDEPGNMLSDVNTICVDVFDIYPRFTKTLFERYTWSAILLSGPYHPVLFE